MANADTPEDAMTARRNGAEGIGLCRTEHMVYSLVTSCFFTVLSPVFCIEERIKCMRKMIMAVTSDQQKEAMNALLPYQRSDFVGIFRAMDDTSLLRLSRINTV